MERSAKGAAAEPNPALPAGAVPVRMKCGLMFPKAVASKVTPLIVTVEPAMLCALNVVPSVLTSVSPEIVVGRPQTMVAERAGTGAAQRAIANRGASQRSMRSPPPELPHGTTPRADAAEP